MPELSPRDLIASALVATDAAGGTLVARDDFSVTRLFEKEAALAAR